VVRRRREDHERHVMGSDGSGKRKKKIQIVPRSRVKMNEVKMRDRGLVKPRERKIFTYHVCSPLHSF
jgi:hypothetical protein